MDSVNKIPYNLIRLIQGGPDELDVKSHSLVGSDIKNTISTQVFAVAGSWILSIKFPYNFWYDKSQNKLAENNYRHNLSTSPTRTTWTIISVPSFENQNKKYQYQYTDTWQVYWYLVSIMVKSLIKRVIGPSDSMTIIPLSHCPTILYWKLSDLWFLLQNFIILDRITISFQI